MARDLNHVVVIGRLVRDPELKYTASGLAIAKFSIANNVSYTQNNELKESVNYFDITVWGNQAINCEKFLNKGSQVAIDGSLRQNTWVDKTTGQNRSKVEINANSVQFLGQPKNQNSQNYTQNFNGTNSNTNFSQPNNNTYNTGNVNNNQTNFVKDPWGDDNNNNSMGGNNTQFSNDQSNNQNGDDIPF